MNPSSPASREILATGTFQIPPGQTLMYVDIAIERQGRRSEGRRIEKATIDPKTPNQWTVHSKKLKEVGEYEIEARLYTRTAKGEELIYETRDIRRVFVKN